MPARLFEKLRGESQLQVETFAKRQNETTTDIATKGHSTTVSIKVSKTLDRGSIPRAPATTEPDYLVGFCRAANSTILWGLDG